MPVLNRARLIPGTIASLLAQTFDDFEILLADGGSTDGTPEIASRLSDKVRVIHQPPDRPGIGAARSIAFGEARGEYVACLDSDDLLLPWALQTYRDAIKQHKNPAFLLADGIMFRYEQALAQATPDTPIFSHYANYLAFLREPRQGWSLASGSVFQTEHAREIAGLSDKIVYAEDSDMFLRLGDKPGFVRVARPITFGYRQHDENTSINFDRFLKGMDQLIDEESAGRYPGGPEAATARRNELTTLLRSAARRCLNRGRLADGFRLYRRTLLWNLQCRKWKFVAGYPALMAIMPFRRKGERPYQPQSTDEMDEAVVT